MAHSNKTIVGLGIPLHLLHTQPFDLRRPPAKLPPPPVWTTTIPCARKQRPTQTHLPTLVIPAPPRADRLACQLLAGWAVCLIVAIVMLATR